MLTTQQVNEITVRLTNCPDGSRCEKFFQITADVIPPDMIVGVLKSQINICLVKKDEVLEFNPAHMEDEDFDPKVHRIREKILKMLDDEPNYNYSKLLFKNNVIKDGVIKQVDLNSKKYFCYLGETFEVYLDNKRVDQKEEYSLAYQISSWLEEISNNQMVLFN